MQHQNQTKELHEGNNDSGKAEQYNASALSQRPVFRDKRVGKTKRHFDELRQDSRLVDREDQFRVSVDNRLIDSITSQLTQSSTSVNDVINRFSFSFPNVLTAMSELDIQRAAKV